jgi:hypothetical protein
LYLYKLEQNYVRNEWAWKLGSSPLPSDATDEEADADVESHAVHPDGRTIFASSSFTFSLDTESGESAFRGSWLLPFHGRAYHDSDLDAWVGIRVADGTEGEDGIIKGDSYLCVCDVPTDLQEPAWKMCKEELTFLKAPAWARRSWLVHTGRGKFSLVEISKGEVRVTMFSAKRDKNGELEVTPSRPGRSYLLPTYCGVLLKAALWV